MQQNPNTQDATPQILALIDRLKAICARSGLGNDAGEYKIITQIFLYKFLSDKFIYEIKCAEPSLKELDSSTLLTHLKALSADDYQMLCEDIGANVAFMPDELLPYLFERQNESNFHKKA